MSSFSEMFVLRALDRNDRLSKQVEVFDILTSGVKKYLKMILKEHWAGITWWCVRVCVCARVSVRVWALVCAGKNHRVPTPCEGIVMLSPEQSRNPNPRDTADREAVSRTPQILRRDFGTQSSEPISLPRLRVRLPYRLLHKTEAVNLGDPMRLWVCISPSVFSRVVGSAPRTSSVGVCVCACVRVCGVGRRRGAGKRGGGGEERNNQQRRFHVISSENLCVNWHLV